MSLQPYEKKGMQHTRASARMLRMHAAQHMDAVACAGKGKILFLQGFPQVPSQEGKKFQIFLIPNWDYSKEWAKVVKRKLKLQVRLIGLKNCKKSPREGPKESIRPRRPADSTCCTCDLPQAHVRATTCALKLTRTCGIVSHMK